MTSPVSLASTIGPFDTFNLFYRDERENRLAELRVNGQARRAAVPVGG